MKDWTGNKKSTFAQIASNSDAIREQHDFYATEPKAIDGLLSKETFTPIVWECACGINTLVERLRELGYDVIATDLIERGYGQGGIDFLKQTGKTEHDIITNPPFKYAEQFIEKAMEIMREKGKLALFLKITFLEGQKRKGLFAKYPPKRIHVFSERIKCAINGDFEQVKSSAVCYAWFVWEKGYQGKTEIDWI